jgi:predicted metal-dependent peptidase
MNFYWDEDFVNSLTLPEGNFLLIHEDCHLLFDHMKRSVGYDRSLANVVQDMIINQIIHDEILCNNELRKIVQIPKDHNEYLLDKDKNPILDKNGNKIKNPAFEQNMGLFIPKEYKGKEAFSVTPNVKIIFA